MATTYTSTFNIGDTIYCFDDQGVGQKTTVTAVNFSVGFNPLAFNEPTDIVYTTALIAADGITPIWRLAAYVWANQAALSTYVLALP